MTEVEGYHKWFQISRWEDTWTIPSITINISQVSILRRRYDSRTRCNQDLGSNVDMRWREAIMTKMKCIPTYWKNLDQSIEFSRIGYKACLRRDQYRDFKDELWYIQILHVHQQQ